jgi:hypothetical protein
VSKRIRMEERRRIITTGLDSTGIETDRYDYEEQPVKKTKKFELIRIKQHLNEMASNI